MRITLPVVGLWMVATGQVGAFTFHWELDDSPEGSERATLVQPVQVLLSDQLLEIAPHSASLQLVRKYSVHLEGGWSAGHAHSLLRTFESIPQEANDPYAAEPRVPASVWRLTHEHVQDDVSIEVENGQRLVTIAQQAFIHSEPLLAEIEGVRGRYYSRRLHEAVVRFVTSGGADRPALKRILENRYGVSVDVPDYAELTRSTTEERAGRFGEFKDEELLFLASMFEEYPEGLRLTPGLQYLVRRLDGTPHPLYPEAPAVAWPSSGYIEFMESAFQGQGPAAIHRLILHEKAHFLWAHLFDDQLRADWIELGGWYESPEDGDGWSTTRQLEFVSAYAHAKNPNEDMAESISYYIVSPDKLRSRSPAKYEFIQNRLMHGVRYISQIRRDLTFQVYNLYPDLVYPGRIIRIDIQVDGEPEQDKQVTIEVEIHRSGDQDGAQASSLRVFSPQGTFYDHWLYPVDENGQQIESGHILRGQTELSRYAALGYWAPDQVTLYDAQGNERHESQTDFGWKLYVDNPLADDEAPTYVENSMRLSLSQAMEDDRAYQILTARWRLFEESGVKGVLALVNDDAPETYSRRLESWGDFDPQSGEASVDLIIPDYFPSGTYHVNSILLEDIGLNSRAVYFTDPHGLSEEELVDEAPQTIQVETSSPDITLPELDVNRIAIQAEPTHPEDPNGETRVDITFRVRDNISGYHSSDMYLRDPQGISHHFRHHGPHFDKVYSQGDPSVYQTHTQTITLPVGSIPGIWGLAEMSVWDRAQNILQADFTEIVRFEVAAPDSQVAIAIPQALLRVSGNEQTAPAGEALPAPFVVSVLDQNQKAHPKAPVIFEIASGGGTLSADTTATDLAGQAAATLTLGREPGLTTVEVLVAGLPAVSFTARGIAVPQTLAMVAGDDQRGAVGAPLTYPFVVSLLDHNRQFLPGVPVTFAVTEGQGTLSVRTAPTDERGQAATVLTLGPNPGTHAVEATVESLEAVRFAAVGETTADFDGDGETGFSDFFLFTEAFGGSDPRFDLDASGSVDFADFFLFAESFGQPARAKLLALARERIGLPREAQLPQNTPNPFNGQTVVEFVLPEPGQARLDVFGLTGQRVAVLAQGLHQAGRHRLLWDARDNRGRPLASGIYLFRLSTAQTVLTRKITLLR